MMMTVNDVKGIKKAVVDCFSLKSMQECSYDDAKEVSLVNETDIGIYDFDEICECIFESIHSECKQPKSLDALYLEVEDKLVFIEFKNSRWRDIKKEEVILKIYDSFSLISKYYNVTFENLRGSKVFLIVKREGGSKGNAFSRKKMNGSCPPNFRFIKESLGIEIQRYDALDFEEYIKKHNTIPNH